MCLGVIGRVVALDGAEAVVVTDTGEQRASALLAEGVELGSDVVVQFGHIVAVLEPERADEARRLQREARERDDDALSERSGSGARRERSGGARASSSGAS